MSMTAVHPTIHPYVVHQCDGHPDHHNYQDRNDDVFYDSTHDEPVGTDLIFCCANFFDLRNTPQTWYAVGIVVLCIFFKPRVFYQVPGDFSTIALAKLPF